MKLINHSDSNIYDIDTYVMRGTIIMTQEEFNWALMFLKKEYTKAKRRCDTYIRDGLSGLEERFKNKGKRNFCLGITATKLLVEKYNLQNYKDVNYGIRIK